MASQLITVQNSTSRNPLQGAAVFIDGANRGSTDVDGNLIIVIASGTYDISVKLSGYDLYAISSAVLPQTNLIVPLSQASSATTATLHLTIRPEDQAAGIEVTVGSSSVIYNSGGVDVPDLPVGEVAISGQAPGFQAFNQSIDLSKSTTAVITMTVSSDDSGGALYPRAAVVQDPDTNSILPPLQPEVVPEYVAPDTGQGTYFTMTQARMYIGDIFIDELNNLQFALQDNKIPIYGYASRFWDAKAQGKSLVQGQFTVNFISEGYLISVLNNYLAKIDQENTTIDAVTKEQQNRLLYLVNQLQNPDPTWTPDQFTRAKNEVKALASSMPPSMVNAAAAQIRVDRQKQLNSILGLPGDDYDNAIYSDVEFDIVIQYTGAGRTITRRLEKCTLISNESIMDHSGTPIMDSYGFIARRLR